MPPIPPNQCQDLQIQPSKQQTQESFALTSYGDLGIRVGKTKKTFVVLVASGRRKSIGHYPHMSLADARKIAKEMLAEKMLGKVRPKHVAFDDAKADFLAEECNPSPAPC
jgi:hypothetical protein